MRSIFFLALAVASIGCRNAPDPSPTVSTSTLPALPPRPPEPQTQVGPGWHWANPTPQGNALWAAVANRECGIVVVGEESTVMRSTDDGATWTTHQSDERWRFKSAALFGTTLYAAGDSSNGAALVAIPNCGDGEQKTIRKLDPKTDGTANAVAVDPQGRIFLTTVLHAHGKILCSKPGATDLATCDDLANEPFYGLFIDKSGRVFAAGGYQGTLGGIVRSSPDHGATWKTIGQHLDGIVYGIWGDADGKRLFATGTSSLFTSTNGGASWTTTAAPMSGGGSMTLGTGDAPYVPNDFSTFIFGSAETGTFFVAGGSAMRGEAFRPYLSPIAEPAVGFYAAVATPGGHWVGVGGNGNIARSIDDGKTWSQISKDNLPKGDAFVDIRSDGLTVYMLRQSLFLRSDDGGRTFAPLDPQDVNEHPVSTRDLVSFAADPTAVLLPRPAKKVIARSTDRGATFQEIPIRVGTGQDVRHVWRGESGSFYASGAAGALFRSKDEGATFAPLSIKTKDDLAAGVAQNRDVYLVGKSSDVGRGEAFHSGNDGGTWTSTALDFEPYGVGAFGADVYVVGRYGQVARSSDKGASFTKTVNLDCGDVTGFVVQDGRVSITCGEGHLYTSTDRGAMFSMKPLPAQVELLFPDGHGGLFAASDRGWSQLLHYF